MDAKGMVDRVVQAVMMVKHQKVTPQQMALYVRTVTNSYLTESDDPTLHQGIGAFGEAPADWGVDGDFTSDDKAELDGGDDMDAPVDHDID